MRFEDFTQLSSTQHDLLTARNKWLQHQVFGPDCAQTGIVYEEASIMSYADPERTKEFRVINWGSPYGVATACTLATEASSTALSHESYFLVTSMTPEYHMAVGVATFSGHEGASYVSQSRVKGVTCSAMLDPHKAMPAFMESSLKRHAQPRALTGKIAVGLDPSVLESLMRHSLSYEGGISYGDAVMDFELPSSLSHRLGGAILSQLHAEHQAGADRSRLMPLRSGPALTGYVLEDDKEGIILAQRNSRQVTISRIFPPRLPDRNIMVQQYRIALDAILFDMTPVELSEQEAAEFGIEVAMAHFMRGNHDYFTRHASEDPAPANELQTTELEHMLLRILSGRRGTAVSQAKPK